MKQLLLVAAVLLPGCSHVHSFYHSPEALASQRVPPRPIKRIGEVSRLPSGLQLVAYQVDGQLDATVRLALQAGPVYEPPGKQGVAELAHLAAWQARTGPAGARLEEVLFAAGTLYELLESPDEVAFQVRCRPAQLGEVVKALARLLDDVAAAVGPEDVEAARGHLLERAERGQTEPGVRARVVAARALAGTAYQRPPAAAHALAALQVEDVRAYLRATFRSERAVFVATAGGSAHETYASIGGALPDRLVGTPARTVAPAAPPELIEPAVRPAGAPEVLKQPGGATELWLAWPLPGSRGPTELAGQASAAALSALLRPKLAALDDVGAASALHVSWDGAAALLLRVPLRRPAAAPKVRAAVDEAAKALARWSGAGAADWMQEATYRAAASGEIGDEARCLRATGQPDALGRLEEQAAGLARDWPAFAARWIAPGPSASVLFEAEGPGAEPAADALVAAARSSSILVDPLATAAPGAAEVVRLVRPPGLDRAHREELPGGMRLVVLPRPGAPYVVSRLVLPGGAVAPTERLAARAALLYTHFDLRFWSGCRGAAPLTAFADAARLDAVQASHRLDLLLEQLGCWSRADPDAPAKLPDAGRPWDWRSAGALEALVTGRPLPLGAPEPAASFGPRYLRRTLRPARATVILVGDVEATAALSAKARSVFADWQSLAPEVPEPEPAATERVLHRFLARRLQRILPSGATASVFPGAVRDARFVTVVLESDAAILPRAVAEVLSQVATLAEAGPPAVELDVVRWDVARRTAYELDTPAEAVEGLTLLATRGLPPDAWERFPADLAAVGPAQVRDAARSLAVGREAVLVVGDATALGPGLRQAGLEWEAGAPPTAQ